ncbi:hypothetical protein [Actinomadura algeriensis]|uniref:Uncharacterized protein n=1 Tax=Actinomadura algeriensis TaxID=1679523 RepID=A0ABR9JZY5_9ACTN|nr:hypothetical protein [Actinomadura algeriensis]MBE1536132.1 hypothetical protein [Actinomadura algeriensis]
MFIAITLVGMTRADRQGLCVLYTGPDKAGGTYRESSATAFGEPIAGIFCMDGGELDTTEFFKYT